jgi:hypothetical protein
MTGVSTSNSNAENVETQLKRPHPEWLTQDEAAELIGCDKLTLIRLNYPRAAGGGHGKRTWYERDAILEFKANRTPRTRVRLGKTQTVRPFRYKGDTRNLEKVLFEIAEEHYPVTVRQLYYQMVVRGLVPKDDAGYRTVTDIVVRMRDAAYDGNPSNCLVMPIDWVVDNSRRNRDRASFTDPADAIDWLGGIYRTDFWHDKAERVLLVIEKDALAGTLHEVTHEYDIPVIVPRGYSSVSYVARIIADEIDHTHVPIFIYYFNDLDPSGEDARRSFGDRLALMAPAADFIVEPVAITLDQIEQHDLWSAGEDTKTTDTRTPAFLKKYGATMKSYELDALPAPVLRSLAAAVIRNHVTDEEHTQQLGFEAMQREELAALIHRGPDLADYAWA